MAVIRVFFIRISTATGPIWLCPCHVYMYMYIAFGSHGLLYTVCLTAAGPIWLCPCHVYSLWISWALIYCMCSNPYSYRARMALSMPCTCTYVYSSWLLCVVILGTGPIRLCPRHQELMRAEGPMPCIYHMCTHGLHV